MRRIVWLVGLVVAVAAPVAAVLPARAVSSSCAKPMAVSSLGHVGATFTVDTTVDTSNPAGENSAGAKVCVTTWNYERVEVSAGHLTFTYGTNGMGGGWAGVCQGWGAGKKCTNAGVLWNGGVWLSPEDVAAMGLTPTVCETDASSSYEHCWVALAGVFVDGPLGATTDVGVGACIGEANEFGLKCIVKVPPTIPAPAPVSVAGSR